MELPLPSQSYQTRSKPLSSQRLVNLYCEVYKDDNGVLKTKSLLGTPGLVENIDFDLSTPIYGASFFKNKIVFCIKNKVFEYDKNVEEKSYTVYNWEDFIQPAMYSNNTYGLMSDSKNTNNSYKITETSTMVGGVYPDEQGITLETAPDYFVKNSELPYIVKWKFDNVIKITALNIATRLLPQNYITARFYLDEEMTQPIGSIFNNNGNNGVATISVSGIPAEGVETDVIYLAILSMEKNENSSCNILIDSYWSWDLEEKNISGLSSSVGPAMFFKNKFYLIAPSIASSTITVYNSTNGYDWSSAAISTSTTGQVTKISGSDSLIFFCAKNHAEYFTSTDGSTWTKRTNLPASITLDSITFTSYTCYKTFYVNGYYLIGCYANSNTTFYDFVLYSTNGTSWNVGTTFYKTSSGQKNIADFEYYNGEYYWIFYNSQSSNKRIYIAKNTNPYTLSGAGYSQGTITSMGKGAHPAWIKSKNDGSIYIGSTGGSYLVYNNDFTSVTELNSYNTNSAILSPINNEEIIASGSSGIVEILTGSLYTDTSSNLGIFSLVSNTFIALGSSITTIGNYTQKSNSIPYIKLDTLHVSGQIQGEPITTYTRKYRKLGIIEDLSSYIDMVDDGDHLFLLHSNGKGYYIEENSDGKLEFKEVQDDSGSGYEYQRLKSVCYLAGRFIGVDYSTGTIRWTEILNPNGWNTLNYIQSETSINELTAVKSNTREAWVFSPKNIEVYTPTGSSDSPSAFARVSGAYIDKGCKYKNCIAMNQNQFYWVATDGCIYRSNGYNAEKISTVALENEIMNYGEQEDILGQIYTQAGHVFYVVKFKTAKKTWCYDISTGLWHERESNDSEWKGDLIISAWNHIYVSDKDKSILYDLDLDVGTDNGDVIKREFVFPTIKNEELRTFHRRLEIDMDTGFSNNENLFLQYSDDGGYTWSSEYWVALGEKAEYNRKLEWRRLGSAITRIYRVRMSTINRVNIIGAYIDMKKGVA